MYVQKGLSQHYSIIVVKINTQVPMMERKKKKKTGIK